MNQRFVDLTQNKILHLPDPWREVCTISRKAGFSMEIHRHDFLQIIHVIDGELEIDIGEGWLKLKAGQVHVQPAGFGHALRSPKGYLQFGINCSVADDQRGFLSCLSEHFQEQRFCRSSLPALEIFFHADNPNLKRAMLSYSIDGYALGLINSKPCPKLNPLAELLKNHLLTKTAITIDVNVVAKDLNLSRATLQRLCQASFGQGVSHFHEKLRMEKALEHLMKGDLSISKCSEICGYGDIFHFSRVFKRIYGLPPSLYRQQVLRQFS